MIKSAFLKKKSNMGLFSPTNKQVHHSIFPEGNFLGIRIGNWKFEWSIPKLQKRGAKSLQLGVEKNT